MVVLLVQTGVGVAETYFVSNLGTAALAGVALVFPALMLMQMMSNGGIGGGVSSAIARALGAGRNGDADALVLHAIVVAWCWAWSLPLPNGGAVQPCFASWADRARNSRLRWVMPISCSPVRS